MHLYFKLRVRESNEKDHSPQVISQYRPFSALQFFHGPQNLIPQLEMFCRKYKWLQFFL